MRKLSVENNSDFQAIVEGRVEVQADILQRADMYDNGDIATMSGYFEVRHRGFTLAEIRQAREAVARRH